MGHIHHRTHPKMVLLSLLYWCIIIQAGLGLLIKIVNILNSFNKDVMLKREDGFFQQVMKIIGIFIINCVMVWMYLINLSLIISN